MWDYLRYYLGPLSVAIGLMGFALGDAWMWLGFGTYFVLAVFDILLPRDLAERRIDSPLLADLPLYIHVFLIVGLYGTFAWRARVDAGVEHWSVLNMVGALASLAWLSAVPNLPIQHELLHRRDSFSRACAFLLGGLYGDPLRSLPHIHGHHIHLGTVQDADTAVRGETMYTFPFRATLSSYRDAIRIESERLIKQGHRFWSVGNRCLQALGFEVFILVVIGLIGGIGAALLSLVALAATKLVLEAFNYYQHYGIVRVPGTKYERRHLWNHLQPVARALAVEITNHSDHHMNAFKPFYRLKPDVEGPQMPSVFLCFMAGLIPPLWFRLILWPRLRDWDRRFATPEERELARAANRRAGWPDWLADLAPAA